MPTAATPADTPGSAALNAKAQAMLEEKEAESRLRAYQGPMRKVLTVLLCLWALFQLYFTTIGVISAINLRAFHCMFLLLFTFLLFPAYQSERRQRTLPPLRDLVLPCPWDPSAI